ncbi:MAG: hypothetical protein IKC64_05750, partial [Clostridia bacterium]|nr:hypothetical protein [Clostridia bacterium]
KFHNLPELTALLSSIADFHQVDVTAGIPQFDGYSDTLITKTKELDAYLKQISKRADIVRSGGVKRTEDNMLKITTDGRKAALDIRLVNDKTRFPQETKVAKCAQNVYQIYTTTHCDKSTQLVFCDSSTPKDEFNVYDELRAELIDLGVKESEIEFVHDATTDRTRSAMFDRVCRGITRVLLGSTFKLGTGVNVQDKLIAIHHLDVPWRPADMHQREGRILRQGNGNDRVFIYRYITEGSFDAYSWQLLETKQRFISGLLSGSIKERSGTDVENTVLDYAEIKALAVGNPLVKQRVETANELNRLYSLQRQTLEEKVRLESELARLPELIEQTALALDGCSKDLKRYKLEKNRYEKIYTSEYKKQLRRIFYEALGNNSMRTSEREVGEYFGFSVILPANMLAEKPYIVLKGEGRYNIYTAGEGGIITRIDNFLDGLEERKAKLTTALADYQHRQKKAIQRLSTPQNYADKIARIEKKLQALDKQLGVNTNND